MCPPGDENIMLMIIAIGLATVYAIFMISDTLQGTHMMITENESMPFHTIAIRILASYMQVTSLLTQFELTLPGPASATVNGLGIVSTIGKQALSFDCATTQTRGYDLFLYKQTVPWLAYS